MSKGQKIAFIVAGVLAVSGIAALAGGNTMGGVETIAAAAIVAAVAYIVGKRKAEQKQDTQAATSAAAPVPAPRTDGKRVRETIRTKVKGVTFDNEDGTNRQDILSRVFEHDQLEIEKYEYNGKPAAYVKCNGEIIGNISADLAESLAERYPDAQYEARITELTGGSEGRTLGCNIEIDIVDD